MGFFSIMVYSISLGIIGFVLVNLLSAIGIEIFASSFFTTLGIGLFFIAIFAEMMMAFY